MMSDTYPTTFKELRRRLGGRCLLSTTHTMEAVRLVNYLRNLGFVIVTANDVLRAIEADPSEEELSVHPCAEGIAVAHASDGWWLLFRHGAVEGTGGATFDDSAPAIAGQA